MTDNSPERRKTELLTRVETMANIGREFVQLAEVNDKYMGLLLAKRAAVIAV